MSILIKYTIDCHCGGQAQNVTLDLSNPRPDGTIQIDIEMAAGQSTFTCDDCGCELSTSDLEYFEEPEECRGAGDDEDDEDDTP